MAKGLFNARRKLAQANSLLRHGSVTNAVQSFYSGLQDMLSEPLLKSEREEFETLLGQIVNSISSNQQVLKVFQMKLAYTPGQEKELLENSKILLDVLETAVVDEAAKRFIEMEADKERKLSDGITALEINNNKRAQALFDALLKEHPQDVSLLVNIAEAYEKHGLFEEAAALLEKAAALDPGAAYIHNKRGIIYRKMKRFDDAESAFSAALAITPDDPYLYFNRGRTFVDSQKWQEALAAGQKALELLPGFQEAKMLADYAKKRV